MVRGVVRSSASPSELETDEKLREIVDFWNQLRACDELDATLWRRLSRQGMWKWRTSGVIVISFPSSSC
jgi:hypothetical protein